MNDIPTTTMSKTCIYDKSRTGAKNKKKSNLTDTCYLAPNSLKMPEIIQIKNFTSDASFPGICLSPLGIILEGI